MKDVAVTKSPDDTRELGAQLGALARAGDVVLVAGDLGSGKTTFVQGFGRALGVTEQIVSPTFMLMRTYRGRIPLLHADVYRLDHLQEVLDLGLPELLDDGVVALIEWGDLAAPALAPDFLQVRIEYADADEERRLSVRTIGPSWSARRRALHEAIERWCAP